MSYRHHELTCYDLTTMDWLMYRSYLTIPNGKMTSKYLREWPRKHCRSNLADITTMLFSASEHMFLFYIVQQGTVHIAAENATSCFEDNSHESILQKCLVIIVSGFHHFLKNKMDIIKSFSPWTNSIMNFGPWIKAHLGSWQTRRYFCKRAEYGIHIRINC